MKQQKHSLNRALLLSIPLTIMISYVVVHTEMVAGRQIAILQLPPVAVGFLFLLVIANFLLKRLIRVSGLNPAELMTIYVMTCIVALISNRNQTGNFTICLPGINYFANETNRWQDRIFPFIKGWLVPFEPTTNGEPASIGQMVAKRYFEGLKPGECIPWSDWVIPIACWSIFFLSILFAFIFMSAILRRPWVEQEKLVFPFTLVPMQLVTEDSFCSFFRSHLAWLGMGIPIFIYTINFFHSNYPAVPEVKLDFGSIQVYLTSFPWTALNAPPFWISFAALGIAYFLHTDFIFSFWFFCWFYRLQWVLLSVVGTSLRYDYYRSGFEGGAYCGLSLMLLRSLLRHLRASLTSEDELIPVRWAILGFTASCFTAATFVWRMGMAWWLGLFCVLFYLLVEVLVRARSVHEGGALMVENGFRADSFLSLLPYRGGFSLMSSFPPTTIVSFALLGNVLMRDLRGIAITPILDGLKMCDLLNMRHRSLLLPITVAVMIGYFCGVMFHIKVRYSYGVLGLHPDARSYPIAHLHWLFNNAVRIIDVGDRWVPGFLSSFIYSFLFTIFVGWMRARFLWWPFHPLPIVLCTAWAGICFWFPSFIGWVLKVVILRYGGRRLYEKSKPFFMGLILGEFAMATIFGFLSAINRNIQTPWMNIW